MHLFPQPDHGVEVVVMEISDVRAAHSAIVPDAAPRPRPARTRRPAPAGLHPPARTRRSARSATPPEICNLSIRAPLFGRERLH